MVILSASAFLTKYMNLGSKVSTIYGAYMIYMCVHVVKILLKRMQMKNSVSKKSQVLRHFCPMLRPQVRYTIQCYHAEEQ